MNRTRIAIGTAGVLLALFGVFRLVTQVPISDVLILGVWLAAAVVIHDGVLSPLIIGVGVLVRRYVPPRARSYLQSALIAGATITVIAIPLILRRNTQPKSKAILQQNYGGNLTLLLAIIGAVTLLAYAARVARDQVKRRSSNAPSHDSPADSAPS